MTENQSEREIRLHKNFDNWNEATTITRYIVIALLGATFYNFSVDGVFYLFVLSILLNGFCYYSMKTTLENIVGDQISHNCKSK